jgi:ribosomal protein RSM22 (predicted rRNA methylase)
VPAAVPLPADLHEALEARLKGVAAAELSRATEELSRRYRTAVAGAPVARSRTDAVAYAAYRMPASYAAAAAAMGAVRERRPGWEPRTLLDLGAGLGAAAWAAAATWPSLDRVTAVEAVPAMTELGRALAADAAHPAVRSARWLDRDLAAPGALEPHDLVVLSYSAGELPAQALPGVLARAWEAADAAVLVVEPGTPRGYRTAVEARAALLAAGGTTVAPCPHDAACPMGGGDWCHFAVRLARSAGHRAAKRVTLGFEDEKYAYAAVAKEQGARAEARILRHPQVRGGHVRLELCTPAGLRSAVVAKREGELYRRARKARWGDAFPWSEAAPAEPSRLQDGPPTAAD